MKELNDELLNKYVDGELSHAETVEMFELIDKNPDTLNKLKAHKFVDQILRDMRIYNAPSGFTEKLMQTISGSVAISKNGSKFFKGIVISFSIMIIGTLGYLFSLASETGSASSDYQIPLFESIKEYISGLNIDPAAIFQNNVILYVGIFLTLILLFTGIFLVDSHKDFKQKLQDL